MKKDKVEFPTGEKCDQTDVFVLCCFSSLQAHISFMRYVSVCCVVGIIAGFCIGPGKLLCTVCECYHSCWHFKMSRFVHVAANHLINCLADQLIMIQQKMSQTTSKHHGKICPTLIQSMQGVLSWPLTKHVQGQSTRYQPNCFVKTLCLALQPSELTLASEDVTFYD